MFEFEEINEIDEIDELNSNTSNGYKYTSAEIWKMGKTAIEEMFKSDFDIADEIADLAGCAIPEAGAAIRK